MNRTIKYLKSAPKYVWVLMLIIVVGIFFRAYNFHDWMSFNADGVRDAVAVSHSVEDGIGELPLLGPRAGGTQLHLGPIFYYFQYISGAIFQSTSPVVYALPNFIFSILIIPFFFLLFREYFSVKFSLALTFMLATCYMAIVYSRFAWNPNSTPFFVILLLLSLLRAYDLDEKNDWRKWAWLAVSGGSLAIASQLHFSAFLGLPAVLVLFAATNWKKTKKLGWKAVLAFFATIVILYIPVFVFEFLTHGKNAVQFLHAIFSKGPQRGVLDILLRDIGVFSKYFLWIVSGIIDANWWQKMLGGIFILTGIFSNIFLLKKETDEAKKRFLKMSLIFTLAFLLLYAPLAFEVNKTRFFLPLLMTPFMMVGFIIVAVEKIGFFKRKVWAVSSILIALLIFGNIKSTFAWFSNMKKSEEGLHLTYQKVSEKNKEFWWTWGRFINAAEHMDGNCERENVIFITSKKTKDLGDSVEYAFEEISGKKILFKEKYKEDYDKYDSCNYYISLVGEDIPEFLVQKNHDNQFEMGDMAILRWYPKSAGSQDFPEKKSSDRNRSLQSKVKSDYPRIFWGDLFK